MVSVIEELRQNDPERTRFAIVLRHETSDADLAQALEQNPFVTDIELDVDEEQQADWNCLLRVIATRGNLEKVQLRDSEQTEQGRSAPPALVRAFLLSFQQDTAIQAVHLEWLRLPADVSTFVDTASSVTSFSLFECDFAPTERERGTRDLAAALQRNTNIGSLKLILEDIYAVPILEGLRINTSVKTFIFSPSVHFSDAVCHALQHLLESTTSIQKFELTQAFVKERHFPLIAQAITGSRCISELKFSRIFHEENTCAQLQSILQNKHNLSSLCLHRCDFGGGQFPEDIISVVLRPGSLLRCFEFYFDGTFSDVQLKNLLQAVEKSKLERFQIGCIETTHQLQILTQSIPLMKLKELEIEFWNYEGSDDADDEEGEFSRETIRQDLLHAVQNNFSLRSLKANDERSETDLFDNDSKQTLAFYVNRNESLDEWVDNPETVDQKVWPEALSLAERAGSNALFRGLHSVLESDYTSLPGGRKRKRLQY